MRGNPGEYILYAPYRRCVVQVENLLWTARHFHLDVVLSSYRSAGVQRSRMLSTLYKDERCSSLAAYGVLQKMYFERIIQSDEVRLLIFSKIFVFDYLLLTPKKKFKMFLEFTEISI